MATTPFRKVRSSFSPPHRWPLGAYEGKSVFDKVFTRLEQDADSILPFVLLGTFQIFIT
jgi:hypothetical protein